MPDRFAYSMSKGAVLTMTYSVACDYVRDGIRCNCIAPARVHTPFVDGYLAKHYPGREAEMFDKLSKTQPIGRMAQPDEVAALALYLCSELGSGVTGDLLAHCIDTAVWLNGSIEKVNGMTETFGEIDPAEKHAISHRSRAFTELARDGQAVERRNRLPP